MRDEASGAHGARAWACLGGFRSRSRRRRRARGDGGALPRRRGRAGRRRRAAPRPPCRADVRRQGEVEELKQAFAELGAESLIVDDELAPAQQRYLEDALEARVVDRTQLILDIFAQHAITAEGKLQVELAQLEYNLPRMRGMWQHLERLGGGVGTRGPGESQLETDRRLARRRISVVKRRLTEVSRQRATRRKERARTSVPTIALAGYTNSGKSTLLNALTDAHVSVEDRLFETLDPTTRAFEHDGRRYLVTDTVGFIRRLPHQLVEGFAATLEETLVADLVLHVVDASQPEERLATSCTPSTTVLHEIGADELPVEIVLNKIDRLAPARSTPAHEPFPDAADLGAHGGGARGAASARRGRVRRALRGSASPPAVQRGRAARRALHAGCSRGGAKGRAGRRLHPRAAAASRPRALRAVRDRRRGAKAGARLTVELAIRRLRPDAVLPQQAYAGDAGLDLAACERVLLGPGERAMVATGLAVAIPSGYAGYVQPRSGLAADTASRS